MKLNTKIITHFTEGGIFSWANTEDIRQKIFWSAEIVKWMGF